MAEVASQSKSAIAGSGRRLWYIYGKAYDLTPLIKWHPGGRDVLEACEGRECTEVFENSHALSNKNIRAQIAQYLVKDVPAGPQPVGFTWKEDGVYAEICRRAKEYFATNKLSHKAPMMFYVKLIPMLVAYATLCYFSLAKGYFLAAFAAGALWMTTLFYGSMHDASHQALSKRPWVNRFWSVLTNHWGLWHHELWLQHHVWGHHSYTGLYFRDPDTVHWPEVFRKHEDCPKTRWQQLQQWTFFIVLMVFPNQYIGQIIAYWGARIRRDNVFEVPALLRVSSRDLVPWTIDALSIATHIVLPVYMLGLWRAIGIISLQFFGSGLLYFMIVAPNHDTDATLKKDGDIGDWGEHQILHSSNFSPNSRILTLFFGGMNFQIEHHLFPTVCNVHYPALSKIVREVCRERNIPYACFPSLLSALAGVKRNMENLRPGRA